MNAHSFPAFSLFSDDEGGVRFRFFIIFTVTKTASKGHTICRELGY
jgi:hypothetical protein